MPYFYSNIQISAPSKLDENLVIQTLKYRGVTTSDTGYFYAPYKPLHMKEEITDISIKKGYRGEWVILIPYRLWSEVYSWCNETFGDPGNKRTYRWRRNWTNRERIFLRYEEDVMIFRLKWSEYIV